ncbi:integrase [Methylobacterium sp. Leaf85]|uniref:integrase n=1 Tax=Methylobacterium sp. Leaf85 TaxID=1736241 RepID=UPI0006F30E16|nr:integrase [Methylobacterium sp. Leaf85]KQO45469.1 integrase [Methylobacterium sp. Leaf85]
MPSDLNAPGLKRRKRKSGPDILYWVARADLVKAGYRPETVRLPYTGDDESHRSLISAACMRFQAEMLEWSSGRKRELNRFDGTILGLSRRYQTDEASPFKRLKHSTRHKDTYTLVLIEKAFGTRSLAALKIDDFYRWYGAAKKPKELGGPERVRRAYGIIKKLREMLAFGIMAELPECKRLYDVLQHARFSQPARRRVSMELSHAEAFIAKALEMGRLSLALGTAIQFETAMRQKDVIGEWGPIPAGGAASGIVLNGRRWVNGLTWSDIAADLVVRKATTKTGAFAAHDLKLCPLVVALLDKVPADRRVGPLILDEMAGRPFAESAYGREWRIVAKAAGVPDHVWNMDARAGAITEAEDAGADLDHIRSAAAHAQTSTTQRYSRGAVGKSRAVANLRVAHRAVKNGA